MCLASLGFEILKAVKTTNCMPACDGSRLSVPVRNITITGMSRRYGIMHSGKRSSRQSKDRVISEQRIWTYVEENLYGIACGSGSAYAASG